MKDGTDCFATDTISIVVISDKILFIPNAFTPNGDGINDEFYVSTLGEKEFHMAIFDKWGNMVFHSEDKNNGWNGTYKSQALSKGAYLYDVKVVYLDGEILQKKGVINLII